VLLDMLSVFDAEQPDADNEAVVSRAFECLNEVEAVSGAIDDETDVVTLEISPLLSAHGIVTSLLVEAWAERADIDRHHVMGSLREHVDRICREEP
jgi:hypothetical protein